MYFFLAAINVMGSGLKTLAKMPGTGQRIEELFNAAENPFVPLLVSLLVTAIFQSSSFTTSLIITLTAAGVLQVDAAVFAVMGANIGTSVTGILVSLGSWRIRHQFQRGFTAALVHDIFNLLAVAVLFPIEWMFAPLAKSAGFVAGIVGFQTQGKPTSPINVITKPVVSTVESAAQQVFSSPTWAASAVAILGLVLLLVSLVFLVKNLKGALLRRIEGLFRTVFFRNDLVAGSVGAVTTVLVQSSSVTTSLIVPLAAAGAVKLRQVFPFVLGANLGTTVTGIIAALAIVDDPATAVNEKAVAATVAISHVLFNLTGIAIWYPLKVVPMTIAQWYGGLAARSRGYAILFLVILFFVVPIMGILITRWWSGPTPGP
ncbi:MAG: Na/Pi symporter [Planctomycetota bacterium]|nr:Na/Pi symporter [Planctomycetota bacterium]